MIFGVPKDTPKTFQVAKSVTDACLLGTLGDGESSAEQREHGAEQGLMSA